jgi:hypothetical protein
MNVRQGGTSIPRSLVIAAQRQEARRLGEVQWEKKLVNLVPRAVNICAER